jgi:ubiquinol-cytochrome c reductase iron-sulfur subunit
MSAPDRTPRHAPASVTVPFGLAACCAAGFAVSYVLDLGTPALGATLGGALALVALGLARWARLIDRAEPMYVEEREIGPAPAPAYRAFRSALTEQPVPRSGVLWGALGLALASIGGAMLFPLRSLLPAMGENPDTELRHTPWRRGARLVTEDGTPIRPEDLEVGSVLTAFPAGVDQRLHVDAVTLLIRLDPADLRLPASRRGWAVSGIVAYSKLCTHAGCPVGLYADTYRQLMCPCHHSIFDAADGAQPLEGPAPRPLPQLPLAVDADGYLIARGDFSAPVGPGWWGHR